jgi:hypothetical protein
MCHKTGSSLGSSSVIFPRSRRLTKIQFRDFDAPLYPAPRPADSSAAVIAASGLLLLAQGETDDTTKSRWIDGALRLLSNTTKFAWKPSWQSLLSNGTADKPANSYSTGIIYGSLSLRPAWLQSLDHIHFSVFQATIISSRRETI